MTQRLSQLVTGTVPACDKKKKTIEEYQNNKMTEIVRKSLFNVSNGRKN